MRTTSRKKFEKYIEVQELEEAPGATGVLADYRDHTDPAYIGPGTWFNIHTMAARADTEEKQLAFIVRMKEISETFPCPVCRGHAKEYIRTHPMEEYLGVMVEIKSKKQNLGMFVWAWLFHNVVNKRLGKPLMSWGTVVELYLSPESLTCNKNCAGAKNIVTSLGTSPSIPSIPQVSRSISVSLIPRDISGHSVPRVGPSIVNKIEPKNPPNNSGQSFRLISINDK